MQPILPHLLNALLYGALALYFWRTRWASTTPLSPVKDVALSTAEHCMILAPLALHTALLARSVFAPDGLHLGVGNAVSAILWLTVLIYWAGHLFQRVDGLQMLVMPVAAAGALLPALLPSLRPLPNTGSPAFAAHLLMAMLAYSLFTIASLHVLLMA
ncbi:MAG: hypothetical protein KIT28_11130, partial [Rubrivivax sp.]|nr:hypothetical protein [Rubrivivax sp.]